MSAPRLREALASIHFGRQDPATSLTREAERTIGRRVAARWGVRAAAVTAALAVAFAGGAALLSAADAAADATRVAARSLPALDPPAFDPAAPSIVKIPVNGGPEFTQRDDAYVCGDPAPGIRPTAWDLALDIRTQADSAWGMPAAVGVPIDLTYLGESDAGVATVGEITLLLVRDGRIAGTIENVANQLVWPLEPGASLETGVGVFSENFACKRRSAEGQHKYFETTVAPGEYDLVAVAHVFSTEESVALGQAVPPWYRLDEGRKDPGGIYTPGSYDCARLNASITVVRGCLPDLAPEAVLDIGGGSLSVRYDPSALVTPFETTLVSKLVPLVLETWGDTPMGQEIQYRNPADFRLVESVEDVACGAVVNDIIPASDSGDGVGVQSRLPSLSALQPGTYRGSVMPWLAPNGSSVRLEAGARLAYLLQREVENAGPQSPGYDVVGFAPVELTGALQYDRYRGPAAVELTVEAPELCPGAGDRRVRFTEPPLLVGTWVVTAPNGAQTRHEVVSTTWPDLS